MKEGKEKEVWPRGTRGGVTCVIYLHEVGGIWKKGKQDRERANRPFFKTPKKVGLKLVGICVKKGLPSFSSEE